METTQVSFTAKDVMALRQKTGLGMMDCKKALNEKNGDMADAERWLREQRKGKMDTRTERTTGEGRVAIQIDGSSAVIVEIRTETDFTSRNDEFISMVQDVISEAAKMPAGPITTNDAITKRIDDVRLTTGENVNFARGEKVEGGSFGSYIHHDNKRGAMIQLEGAVDADVLTGVCMHIVAHVPPPVGISADDVPAETLENIRKQATDEARDTGKPDEIAQKIAEGKVRKFLEENTLLDQKYVKDPSGKQSVRDALGKNVTVKRFIRYAVGGE